MLGGSAPPLLFLSLGPFCPGLAIPCSTHLHGSGWVRACPLGHATLFTQHRETGCGGLLLFLCDCLSLTRAGLQPLGLLDSCQVQTPVDLAFSGYYSMVVASWLDPLCELTQSLESDTGDGLEAGLHVRYKLKRLLFFDGPPLLLVWPQIVKELIPQLLPLHLHMGGVVVAVEGLRIWPGSFFHPALL